MRNFVIIIAFLLSSLTTIGQKLSVYDLTCEFQNNPMGIDIVQPRFGWKIAGSGRNVMQHSYSIRVARTPGFAKKDMLWESGKVNSGESVWQRYQGPSLESDKQYFWQVKIWDSTGKESAWSPIAHWQMGLLNKSDWTARWIEGIDIVDSVNGPGILFRTEFSNAKAIRSATAYISAHGMYEAFINGKRIGDGYLAPGWTSYNKRLQYQVYDVKDLLSSGQNAIGVSMASGWYRTALGWQTNKGIYGKTLALLLQLKITFTDGTTQTIITDDGWKVTDDGPVRFSELYDGEIYDARKEKDGWARPGFNASAWKAVAVKEHAMDVLLSTYNEPIRKHETFKPKAIFKTPKGEHVIDFGQNLVGWVQVRVKGDAGTQVVLKHAEVLDKEGNFYTENLRDALQQNTFILKGNGDEMFEPHFTFQGFRYVQVIGYPGELKPENFTAVALYSDMKPTGTFECSNPLLNQLQHNIQWGQKGNFVDVPTDCPQRDERLGWTGDAQVFAATAAYNMKVYNFFAKWLKDVAADQTENGGVPYVVPNVLGKNAVGSAGWADAATIIPWDMYVAYGDKKILEDQYGSMKAWIGFMESKSKNDLWNTGFHFGDWLFFRPADDTDGRSAVTDKYLIAQCFWAHSTQLMIKTARVLGKTEDVKRYEDLLGRIKGAFVKEYMTPNGRLVSGTQTAYVLALNFDMLPETLRAQAAERLAENVRSYGNHLTTGFLGTPYLCHVLTRFGYDDVAYKLLLQDTYPSWLYPVKMGATTIWERWDGQKTDSTFQTPGMNSFNHYAYGAIGDWMYKTIAGIRNDELRPGYKHTIIRPHTGGDLNTVAAEFNSNYGLIRSSWKAAGKQFTLDVVIPPNTTATIYIPADGATGVKESSRALSAVKDIKTIGQQGDYLVVETGSGSFRFTSTLK